MEGVLYVTEYNFNFQNPKFLLFPALEDVRDVEVEILTENFLVFKIGL